MNSSNLQLLIVQEVQEIAFALNFQIWLRGWAIDFLLGKITHEHSDVDLDTWIQLREPSERDVLQIDSQIGYGLKMPYRIGWIL